MLPRDDFATALLIQLAEAGEAAAVYDAGSFSIVRPPAAADGAEFSRPLDAWYEAFLQAEPRGQGDQVIREFVADWLQRANLSIAAAPQKEEPVTLELAADEAHQPAASPFPAAPLAATPLARPLPPPPEFKPPPEPSWWPLLGCGAVAVLSLGCCVAGIFGGIGWIEHAVSSQTADANQAAERIAQQRAADQARRQQGLQNQAAARMRENPRPAVPLGQPPAIEKTDIPAMPMPPLGQPSIAPTLPAEEPGNVEPAAAREPDPIELEAARFQEDIREAMRQFERQMAELGQPPVRLPAGVPVPPLPLPPGPPGVKLPPLPELKAAEVELPRLAFGPADISAVGPEVRGDRLFQDVAPAGGWLVGFRAIKGESWGGSILALQPIYQVGSEYSLGEQCGGGVGGSDQQQFLAKPGYAVGKIEAKLGLIMNAFRIEFRRVKDGRLDTADSYFSEWYGGDGGGLTELDGGASPLVGIAGSYHPRDEVIAIQSLKVE